MSNVASPMNSTHSDSHCSVDSTKLDGQCSDEDPTGAALLAPGLAEVESDEEIPDRVESMVVDNDQDTNGSVARRSSIASVLTFAESQPQANCCRNPTAEWSKQRKILAVCGCVSSILVCIIRLKVDPGYQTYTIHSIVVFFDMILIHLFTATRWLSISGESITIVSVILYHYTKQKVWELLETTLLAMICSFHMISSRSEHWDREEELEGLIGLEIIPCDNANNTLRRSATVDLQDTSDEHRNLTTATASSFHTDRTMEEKESNGKLKLKSCSKHFFEHFLDGSAGVMYTSFLGLIIDEFIMWGTSMDSKSKA